MKLKNKKTIPKEPKIKVKLKRSTRCPKTSGNRVSTDSSQDLSVLDSLLCELYKSPAYGDENGIRKRPKRLVRVGKQNKTDVDSSITIKRNENVGKRRPRTIATEVPKSKIRSCRSSNREALLQTDMSTNDSKGCSKKLTRSFEYIKLDNKEYKCAKCEFTGSHLVTIKTHYDKKHNETPYKCQLCPFETRLQYYFNRHVKCHSKPDMECPHCNKTIRWFSYKMHLKTHERNTQTEYKCEICNYTSYNHANVKRHTLAIHKDPLEVKTFECKQCNYITILKERLKQHERTVHSKEGVWLKCLECDYSTRNKSHLTRHKNDVHGEKTVRCSECGQLFSSKENLKYHTLRRHTDLNEKTFYYCEMCPKENQYKTTEKGNLARHILAHRTLDEIEVFACHKCSYLGKSRNALKTHLINAHFPQMHSFKCESCGYSTNTKSRFKNHLRDVHCKSKPGKNRSSRADREGNLLTIDEMSDYIEIDVKDELNAVYLRNEGMIEEEEGSFDLV